MSRAYQDERIDVVDGVVTTLNADYLSPPGLSRATSAILENSVDSPSFVLYRYGKPPVNSPPTGHILKIGERVEIVGFDNLLSLMMIPNTTGSASLFVSYFT